MTLYHKQMSLYIRASLFVNIVFSLVLCLGIWKRTGLALYSEQLLGTALGSLMLFHLGLGSVSMWLVLCCKEKFAVAFLLLQIFYKSIFPFARGDFWSPLILANLIISSFHTVTVIHALSLMNPFKNNHQPT